MRATLSLLCLLLLSIGLALFVSSSSAENDAAVTGAFGDPIPGLASADLAAFERGKAIFEKRFTPSEGLGPHFNSVSCKGCHATPATGGSAQRYRDFFILARQNADGTTPKYYASCTVEMDRDAQLCLPSIVVPNYGPIGTIAEPVAADVSHPPIPAAPDAIVARRNAPPVFGLGLFRLVSDDEILSRADPDDADGDGISGRVNRIPAEENAIGRFGYKCQAATIEAFNRGALNNQRGITSDSTAVKVGAAYERGERGGGGEGGEGGDRRESPARRLLDELLGVRVAYAQVSEPKDRVKDLDDVPDPELTVPELQSLVAFQEHLAAPRRGAITPSVRKGEEVFARIGCTACHAPSLSTPLGLIHPYTDLLIHDMGAGLADGIKMAQASGSELRTQPLWGLCQHGPFLHDGRADTVSDAVLAHGGEAQASRDRYVELQPADREALHRFLESL
ncbi:MAG: hypothetical protein HY721_24085 [Planctomycetes bacterium]|nr:hypothetical protein [Planctomycetota bacterium]